MLAQNVLPRPSNPHYRTNLALASTEEVPIVVLGVQEVHPCFCVGRPERQPG